MTMNNAATLPLEEPSPRDDSFAADVIDGLSKARKTLSPRFFYDALGSALFEEITQLPEYYPTRTEVAILDAHADEIADDVPPGSALLEFGSGSSYKTQILLDVLPQLAAYVAVDVSETALNGAQQRLSVAFPIA